MMGGRGAREGEEELLQPGDPSSAALMGFFFRRNDQETIQIIAKAATIVPKACDILGISLSDSESEAEDENDDTAVAHEERSPTTRSHHHESDSDTDDSIARIEGEGASDGDDSSVNVDSHQVQEASRLLKPNFRARLRTPTPTGLGGALGSHVRKSRKRCASTPSTLNLGQSTSSTSEDLRGFNPPTNKKRRFPSISISGPRPDSSDTTNNGSGANSAGDFSGLGGDVNPSWGNLTPEEQAIRMKMMHDMELLQEQLTELAGLEKQQFALMQRYLRVSKQQQQLQIGEGASAAIATTSTNSDGTNDTAATTTTTIFEQENRNGASNTGNAEGGINQSEQVANIDIDINDAEIFTDADLNIGAEVVVDTEVEADDQEVGSLI